MHWSRWAAGWLGATAVVLAACTGGTGATGSLTPRTAPYGGEATTATTSGSPRPVRWAEVTLPRDVGAVTLATSGDDLVVGALGGERPLPRLLAGADSSTLREVPLTPRSPYAFEARWFSLATRGGQVEAVGGARGGAHGNYRWSTWSGDLSGLAEQEQPFGVFGSWGAGDLVGVAFAGAEPVVLGAWQSERTGLDIAIWRRTGTRWNRQRSTGTALGSTPQELLSAGAIAPLEPGLVLSGSVTRLAPGSVRVDPAVWTSPGASGPWTRTDLPRRAGTASSEAHGTTCSSTRCLVAGVTGSQLALWELRGRAARTLTGIPAVTLPEGGRALPPLTLTGADVVVVPTPGGCRLLQRAGQGWSVLAGPAGTPTSAVVHDREVWLVTTDAAGRGTLWHSGL